MHLVRAPLSCLGRFWLLIERFTSAALFTPLALDIIQVFDVLG